MSNVSFRPLAHEDLPLVGRWLREPHVWRWWKESWAPDGVEEKYLPLIRGDEPTEVFIVVLDGRDIGLIQSYRISDHPQWAQTISGTGLALPPAAGIDYFIGEADLVGGRIGSAALSVRVM